MDPLAALAEHRRRPQRLGKMLNPSVTGDVGSIIAGDALRLYLRLEDERIADARFQVFNAAEQVAPASVACELFIGRSLDEALRLRPADLCAHLGGLDPRELPPFVWALEALRVAAATWRGEVVEGDEELPPLLCRCHGLAEDTVRESIQVMGLTDVQQVVDATGAGTGCGSCRADIPRLLAPPSESAPRRGPTGRIALAKRIAAVAEAEARPFLERQGGRLELWDLAGQRVLVRCHGVPEAARGELLAAVQAALVRELGPGLVVEEAEPSASAPRSGGG